MAELTHNRYMRKSYWINLILLSLAATGIHFLYSATGFAPFKLIAPINESIWEHSKLLVTPFVIFSIIYFIVTKPKSKLQYVATVGKSCIAIQIAMIAIYYTYSGILGKGNIVCDIILTYVCVFIGLNIIYDYPRKNIRFPAVWIALLIIQLVSLIVFTCWQPQLALFISHA